MLLWLAQQFEAQLHILGVVQYLTLRAILGVLTALGISLLAGPWFIRTMESMQMGQSVRSDGPKSHLSKSGTPTMGGIMMVSAIIIATLLWADIRNKYIILMLVSVLWLGFVGFLDDFIKLRFKRSKGLSARAKFIGQISLGLIIGVFIYMDP